MQQVIKIDTYTKVVLTIIAASLVWIALGRITTPAWGQLETPAYNQQRLLEGQLRFNRLPVQPTGPIDVRLVAVGQRLGRPLPVQVTNAVNVTVPAARR